MIIDLDFNHDADDDHHHHHYRFQNFIPIFMFWPSIWCSSLSSSSASVSFHVYLQHSLHLHSPLSLESSLSWSSSSSSSSSSSAAARLCFFAHSCGIASPYNRLAMWLFVVNLGESQASFLKKRQTACPRCCRDRNQEPCEKHQPLGSLAISCWTLAKQSLAS